MRRVISLLVWSLCFASSAYADEANAEEKAILELVNKGKERAGEIVENLHGEREEKRTTFVPPAPVLPVEEDVITRLSRQVASLKEKDALLKASFVATQRPKDVKRIGANTIYNYKEGAVYEVHAGIDRITDIQLAEGETLSGPPAAGDTVRWKMNVIQSGTKGSERTHIILKPLESDIETNLILTTDKHVYHLRCLSSDWHMPSISWNYPLEESPEYQELKRKEEFEEPLQVAPEQLRFDYEIDGDSYAWKPLRVFDDGAKTYIQMPRSMRVSEAPVLFVIDDDEPEPILVNYRVKGEYYIVDRLFDEAELRVGKKKSVEIERRDHRSFFERIF